MTETNSLVLIVFGVPFFCFLVMFCWLVTTNRKTTAEVRLTLPPDVFLKIIAVMLVVVVTFLLTYLRIMEVSVTAAILGSVVTGTIASIKKGE
jgi:hypothetical protein